MSESANFPLSGEGQNFPADMAAGATPQAPVAAPLHSNELSSDATAPAPSGAVDAAPMGPVARAGAKAAAAIPGAERRRRRRALISAPVRVRGTHVTEQSCPDEVCMTIDVSRIGVLFVTDDPAYYRGMDVVVTFPYSPAPTAIHAEQPGRVARVVEMVDGRRAVALALGKAVDEGAGRDLVDSCGRTLAKAPELAATATSPDPQKTLVLVMDADAAVRDSLKAYLMNEGYEVIAVPNCADAREVLNIYTPALLIAEVEGEGLPGFELCAHVKSTDRLRKVPVVLTTRSGYPSDYSNAHSLGAVVCMTKPYRQEKLGHVVRLLAPTPQAMLQPGPAPRACAPANGSANGKANGNDSAKRSWFRL